MLQLRGCRGEEGEQEGGGMARQLHAGSGGRERRQGGREGRKGLETSLACADVAARRDM